MYNVNLRKVVFSAENLMSNANNFTNRILIYLNVAEKLQYNFTTQNVTIVIHVRIHKIAIKLK